MQAVGKIKEKQNKQPSYIKMFNTFTLKKLLSRQGLNSTGIIQENFNYSHTKF